MLNQSIQLIACLFFSRNIYYMVIYQQPRHDICQAIEEEISQITIHQIPQID
jgi:hypothetical protein